MLTRNKTKDVIHDLKQNTAWTKQNINTSAEITMWCVLTEINNNLRCGTFCLNLVKRMWTKYQT